MTEPGSDLSHVREQFIAAQLAGDRRQALELFLLEGQFTAGIRSFVESPGDEDAIVASALGTFRSLRTWCDESAGAP
jgi:hypothetical protein